MGQNHDTCGCLEKDTRVCVKQLGDHCGPPFFSDNDAIHMFYVEGHGSPSMGEGLWKNTKGAGAASPGMGAVWECVDYIQFGDAVARVCYGSADAKKETTTLSYSIDESVCPKRIQFRSGFMYGRGIFKVEKSGKHIHTLQLQMCDLSCPEEGWPEDFEVDPHKHYVLLELFALQLTGTWQNDTGGPAKSLVFDENSKVTGRGVGLPDPPEPIDFRVDNTTQPLQITFISRDGEAPGIYEFLDSCTVRICVGNHTEGRPTEFKEVAGKSYSLFTLRKTPSLDDDTCPPPGWEVDHELDGEWKEEATEDRGLVFCGPQVTVKGGPCPGTIGCRLNKATNPRQITFFKDAAETLCIYKFLDPSTLKICLCNTTGPRPTDFEVIPGSPYSLLTYRKVPDNVESNCAEQHSAEILGTWYDCEGHCFLSFDGHTMTTKSETGGSPETVPYTIDETTTPKRITIGGVGSTPWVISGIYEMVGSEAMRLCIWESNRPPQECDRPTEFLEVPGRQKICSLIRKHPLG
ncbi:hypothetical protein Pelo_1880 [Pelomyxa schiedti]|nr:hypothetical protein Pelo_1880 [Pelomyxa schiedti]